MRSLGPYGGVCRPPPYNNLKPDEVSADCSGLSPTSATALHVLPPVTMQVMAKFLWSFITPWLRKDVHIVTQVRETFGRSPFIGVHIRRGDKISGEGHMGLKKSAEVITTVASCGKDHYFVCYGGGARAWYMQAPHLRNSTRIAHPNKHR